MTQPQQAMAPLGSRDEAEGYVAMICFKHGPPVRHGVELEWTVHHADDPASDIDAGHLADALGAHAPQTLIPDSPHRPLPHGSRLTVEPGGQVEISSPPRESVTGLLDAAGSDVDIVVDVLRRAGLVLGDRGIDPHRQPRRILDVPRYAAMQTVFDGYGAHGSRMMCSTASVQVCLDAGEPAQVATRWRAAHAVGPPLVALFANSREVAGRDSGWASARFRSTLGTCPPYTSPPTHSQDPAAAWARLAMEAPVICLRRDGACWDAPRGLTFGDWAEGALDHQPTVDDLDYHLSTLFPPVRPRGYLEIRYLDAQPRDRWRHAVLLLAALLSDPATIDATLDATEMAADRWLPAARYGLDDEQILEEASALVELGCAAMPRLGVDDAQVALTAEALERRIVDHSMRRHSA